MKSQKVRYRGQFYYLWSGANQYVISTDFKDVGKKGFVLRYEEYMEVELLEEIRDEKINQLLNVEDK